MSDYVKGVNTADGKKPFFPAAEPGMFWGTNADGEWSPVAAGPGGSSPSLDTIVAAVLAALPTWNGGDF